MKRRLCLVLCLVLCLSLLAPMAQAQQPEQDGFVELKLPPESGEVFNLVGMGKRLLLVGFGFMQEDPLRLTLVDAENGSVIAVAKLPNPPGEESGYSARFLADGRILCANQTTAYLWDKDLQNLKQIDLPQGEDDLFAYIDESGRWVWTVNAASNEITGRSLQGEENRTLRLAQDGSLQFYGFQGVFGEELAFTFGDPEGRSIEYRYHLHTGKLRVMPALPDLYPLGDGERVYAVQGERAFFSEPGGRENLLQIGAWEGMEYPLAATGPLLLSNLSSITADIKVYDLDRGLVLAQAARPERFPGTWYAGALLPDMQAAALLLTAWQELDEGPAEQTLLLWHYGRVENPRDAKVERTSLSGLADTNNGLVRDIEYRHGVRVFVRQEGASFRNDTYEGVPELSELNLYMTLQGLRALLDKLPPNFLRESVVPPYQYLAFYLAGSIRQTGSGGIQAPAGFAAFDNDERYIAITSGDYALGGTLAHELMHVLEDRVFPADNTGYQRHERYQSLSPKDFAKGGYKFSYFGDEGEPLFAPDYTAMDSPDFDPIYYLDSYSRTLPLEDRATLFEALYGGGFKVQLILDNPKLLEKAQYLRHLLRESFPSVQAVPIAIWEEQLPEDTTDWDAVFEGVPAA